MKKNNLIRNSTQRNKLKPEGQACTAANCRTNSYVIYVLLSQWQATISTIHVFYEQGLYLQGSARLIFRSSWPPVGGRAPACQWLHKWDTCADTRWVLGCVTRDRVYPHRDQWYTAAYKTVCQCNPWCKTPWCKMTEQILRTRETVVQMRFRCHPCAHNSPIPLFSKSKRMPRLELLVWRLSETSKGGFTNLVSENVKSAAVREHGTEDKVQWRQVIGPWRRRSTILWITLWLIRS